MVECVVDCVVGVCGDQRRGPESFHFGLGADDFASRALELLQFRSSQEFWRGADERKQEKVYCGTISNIRLEQSAPFRHLSLMHGVLLDGLSSCPRSLTVGSSVCNGDGCVPVFFRGGAPPPRKGLFQPQPNNLAQ